MGYYTLQLFPTDHQWDDGNYLMQHNWISLTNQWGATPAPPVLDPDKDMFNITFNVDVSTVTGSPILDLSGHPPVGEIKGLEGSEVANGQQFNFGSSSGTWTPSTEGTFSFNALVKATVNGETKTYKADPEMVVSNDGGGGTLSRE